MRLPSFIQSLFAPKASVHNRENIDGMVRIIAEAIEKCENKADTDRLLAAMQVNLVKAYAGNKYAAKKAEELRMAIGAKLTMLMIAGIRTRQLQVIHKAQRN